MRTEALEDALVLATRTRTTRPPSFSCSGCAVRWQGWLKQGTTAPPNWRWEPTGLVCPGCLGRLTTSRKAKRGAKPVKPTVERTVQVEAHPLCNARIPGT